MRKRASGGMVGVLMGLLAAGCGSGDDDAESVHQAVGFCSDGTPGLRGVVCGVGEIGGRLAIHHGGRWFSIGDVGSTWTVENDVPATFRPIAPVDSTEVLSGSDCQCTTRDECIERCGSARAPQTRVDRRRWTVPIGGRTYEVEAREVIYDEAVSPSCVEQLRMTSDLVFEIRTTDREDGNPWTVLVTPRRVAIGLGSSQEQLNTMATEPGVPSQIGAPGTIITAPNVRYAPDVELASAVKSGVSGRDAESVQGNPALQRALDRVLAADPSFQSSVGLDDTTRRELLRSHGSTASRRAGAGDVLFDLERATDFFLDTKRGHAGWSSKGHDRPMVEANGKHLVVRRGAGYDRTVRFPFLAGICGLEASFGAFVRSEFAASQRKCFDALAFAEASGFVEAGVRAGGGFGCNLLVASAAAGLEATASAYAHFRTSVSSAPPSLAAEVTLKSRVAFHGYFRTRALFWTKKWEGRIAGFDLVNRQERFELAPTPGLPAVTACEAVATAGDCDDPNATCDVTDRCVRYDDRAEGSPVRVDVGPCNSLAAGRPRGTCFPQAVQLWDALTTTSPAGEEWCSGTLVANDTIVTAGHCLDRKSPGQMFVKDRNGSPIVGKRLVRHPGFDACRADDRAWGLPEGQLGSDVSDWDVAVLQLAGGLPGIIPAKLDTEATYAPIVLTAVGFGWGSKEGGSMGVFDPMNWSPADPQRTVIVQGRSGAALLPGDSGGPLFRGAGCGGVDAAPTLHAVVSTSRGDTMANASVVSFHRDFLDRAMRNLDVAPVECCPGRRTNRCTLPGGAVGKRPCDDSGRWAGPCAP